MLSYSTCLSIFSSCLLQKEKGQYFKTKPNENMTSLVTCKSNASDEEGKFWLRWIIPPKHQQLWWLLLSLSCTPYSSSGLLFPLGLCCIWRVLIIGQQGSETEWRVAQRWAKCHHFSSFRNADLLSSIHSLLKSNKEVYIRGLWFDRISQKSWYSISVYVSK